MKEHRLRTECAQGSWLNYPLPLIGGGAAMLSIPIPLTSENHAHLAKLIATVLEGLQAAIVVDPTAANAASA